MHRYTRIASVLILFVASGSMLSAAAPAPERIAQIAAMLPPAPRGLGEKIENREFWGRLAASPPFAEIVKEAEELEKAPIPEVTEDLFRDFSRTGNRSRCQKVLGTHSRRLTTFVLAECLENKGRFLKAIEEMVRLYSEQITWVLPAHDRQLDNYEKRTVEIDLASSRISWNLATADYWLGNRLSPQTRQVIRQQLENRLLKPFEGGVTSGEPQLKWLTRQNNWNSVCLAGVVGVALTVVEEPQRRAFFIAAAEDYRKYFLMSMPKDGYCTEGVAYWNYGFGHYIMLSEEIQLATDGQMDWLREPTATRVAAYPWRVRLKDNLYPSFSDCGINSAPNSLFLNYLASRIGKSGESIRSPKAMQGAAAYSRLVLATVGFYQFDPSTLPNAHLSPVNQPRGWFPEHIVLVCRPNAADTQQPFTAAIKGGHNAEQHNHNDVGSFVAALGDKKLIVDPGREVYTSRTFGAQRYESRLINSFGHGVPRVAGKLQRKGPDAQAKIVSKRFGEAEDSLTLDIASAYDVKELEKLHRAFRYSRAGRGRLSITDTFAFDSPQEFETSLITIHDWRTGGPGELLIGEPGAGVRVRVSHEPPDAAIAIQDAEINEDNGPAPTPTRIALRFSKPLAAGSVKMSVTPWEE